MSAYIVNKRHILYLVTMATNPAILGHHSHSFRWHYSNPMQHGEMAMGDYDRAAQVANMLWRENIRSVSFRYPGETTAELPGPIGEEFIVTPPDFCGNDFGELNIAQVFKACDCYEYQSCEHEEWQDSEAKAFIDSLRKHAWHCIPGYGAAEWGPPETTAERRRKLRTQLA